MSLLPSQQDIPFRDISKLLLTNSAFINPFGGILTTTSTSLSNLSTYVEDASNILHPDYDADIALNATQITVAVNSLITSVNRFTSHTNNLSGISLSNGLNGANFATISSIVSTVQEYRNDGSICELVYGAFGAILNAAAIVQQLELLLGRISNILSIPDQIADNLDFVRLLLEEQIESDLNTFAAAQIEALQYAASAAINALINNECISEVLTRIGSQELKNIIRERTSEVF